MDLLIGSYSETMLIIIALIGIIIAVWMFGLKLKFKAGNIEIAAERKEEIKDDNTIDVICRYANEKMSSFVVQLHEHYIYLMGHKAKYIGIKNLTSTKESKLVDVFFKLWKDDIINDLRATLLENDFKKLTPDIVNMLKSGKFEFWINRFIYLCDEYWIQEYCSVMQEDFELILKLQYKHVFENIVDEIFGFISQK